jgi:hypothetical protein
VLIQLLAGMSSPAAVIFTRLPEPWLGIPRDAESETGLDVLSLDFNADGTAEFLYGVAAGWAAIYHDAENSVFIRGSPPPNIGGPAAKITGGVAIYGQMGDSSFNWYAGSAVPAYYKEILGASFPDRETTVGIGSNGHALGTSGYYGLQFELEDGTHYGWIAVDGEANPAAPGGLITGWAWETSPGVPIIAGAVPEPSVAALIIPAVLFAARRRREEKEGHRG